MVGMTNFELDSIVKQSFEEQEGFKTKIEKTTGNLETQVKEMKAEFVKANSKTENTLAEIINWLAALTAATTKKEAPVKEIAGRDSQSSRDKSSPEIKHSPATKPAGEPHPAQFFDAPPEQLKNESESDGTINLYRPPLKERSENTTQEIKIKRYFPDFFTRAEATNPNSPLKEASDRNRVVFPPDCKLKYASSNTIEKLHLMQVPMIQSMLPYPAWPTRVALEMDDDFLSARRTIKNHSLDWAGAVDCILKVLFNHDALESPLTTFAKLTAKNGEIALDFARRLRKTFFSLPSDLQAGPQARDVLRHHVRLSLPRTWTNISHRTSKIANEESADLIFQITEGISR
ncbi:hypothetical protein K3495_g4038 [Podosphaera aphanis]|nr:hypothetical protein K3495_g4038 [Podosphaera aphanis]